MPEATALSIGEVINLLRDDFPNVSVSKLNDQQFLFWICGTSQRNPLYQGVSSRAGRIRTDDLVTPSYNRHPESPVNS